MQMYLRNLFVVLFVFCSVITTVQAQSNHLIVLDGTNDFFAGENMGVEAGRTCYLTWDSANVYIGISGNPVVSTSSNLYVVFDTDPASNSDPRTSGTGRSDQPTGESGGATYPVSANVVFQFYGTGSDDAVAVNPAPGNKFTTGGAAWSSSPISSGVRIIRTTSTLTEIQIPFSELGIAFFGEFNAMIYIANNTPGGNIFAEWPTGNADGNNPILKDFYTFTRESGILQNAMTHYSYREHSTTGYTFGNDSYGSIFFVPASPTTYLCGALTTIGYHLYIGPNATFSMGTNVFELFVYRKTTLDGTLALSSGIGGNLVVGGDFTANGTFNLNGGSVILRGFNLQTISGPSAVFENLTISNPSNVALGSPCSVNGTLTLANGKFALGANTLTIGASGSITGDSLTRFILTNGSGVLKRSNVGATNTRFPVGIDTTYNPVTINNSGTVDTFSVRVQGSFDAGNPPNNANAVLTRQWTITEAIPGGSNATLVFQWNDTDPHGVAFDPATNGVQIGRWTGTQWNGTIAVFGGTNPRTATASNITAFSPFGVASLNALPIQLSSFTASALSGGAIQLRWTTLSEINDYGFYIERRQVSESAWLELASSFVAGNGTTNLPHSYTFVDNSAMIGSWQYRLKQVDLDGAIHYTEPILANSLTDVKETAPRQFALLQNYPNPFNPSTEIKFAVETTDRAVLSVYNTLGQKVVTLFDDVAIAGQFYKVRFDGVSLSSGMYFYSLQSGTKNDLKKLVLLK